MVATAIAGICGGLPASASAQSAVEGRPVVARSSAESHAAALPDLSDGDVQVVLAALGESQLDFFDDLERQPLVCHDDALHACLLLGAGINATTFEQRTAMAAQLGWIAPNFDRPAREAATIGEICRIATAMLDGRGERTNPTPEQALQRIAQISPVPAGLKPFQGITGAQLLSVLAGVHDAMSLSTASTSGTATPQTPATRTDAARESVAPLAPAPAPQPTSTPSSTPVPAQDPLPPVQTQPVPNAERSGVSTAGGDSVHVADVPPSEPGTTRPPVELTLPVESPAASTPAHSSAPTAAHEPVIALEEQPRPASSAVQPAPPVVETAQQPAADTEPSKQSQPVRASQFVPGRPLRRPTAK